MAPVTEAEAGIRKAVVERQRTKVEPDRAGGMEGRGAARGVESRGGGRSTTDQDGAGGMMEPDGAGGLTGHGGDE